MSFMPNVGSLVRLKNGQIGIVTKITPKGDDDRVWTFGAEERTTAWQIAEILYEPEHT